MNTHGARATDAQARKTALLIGGVLLLVAAWNLYRGRTTVLVIFGSVGALLLVAGLFVRAAARAFHNAWMRLASALGYVNSRVLLPIIVVLLLLGVLLIFAQSSALAPFIYTIF